MLGSQQKAAYMIFLLEAVASTIVRYMGVFADPTVNNPHVMRLFGIAGDSVSNLPPHIVRQTSMATMNRPRICASPPRVGHSFFIP
jgi:hypothetical protein